MTTFAGKWHATFGPMELAQQGTRVWGDYAFRGTHCTLDGEVRGDRLVFTYQEPGARGEGWFELTRKGQAFAGQWRADGDPQWRPWVGSRVGFDGLWDTDFGRMRLVQEGERVHGFYELGGGSTVEGRVEGNELTFTYREPNSGGEGQFLLSPDGLTFQGEWRQEGKQGWLSWQGVRTLPRADLTWLVVLEVPWHAISSDKDYSFGNMLSEFFSRQPSVRVRQRFFTNEAALRRHLREVTLIAEPVVLVVATHGMPQGIPLDGGTAGVQTVGDSLAYAWDLRLLHFSACLLMQDPAVVEGWQNLATRLGFPISGYTTSVDWAGSAIIEFTYLDMILARGMDPEQAADQVLRLLPFAGDEEVEGGAIAPAGFRLVLPEGTAGPREATDETAYA
jgi:hypothetical protein